MNITLSREIDPGREVISMLCGLANERFPSADQRADGLMRSAATHYLTSPALRPLRPALDALTDLEEHVLSAVSVDDERLRRLFTAPRMETQPGIHLYISMQRGNTPGLCAQDILLSMRDDEFSPYEPQEVPLDAFVREATALGYDREYVMNLTQMLACWDADMAWLRTLLDRAIPRFEEKRALVQPLVDSWADALEPRLPKMRETVFATPSSFSPPGTMKSLPMGFWGSPARPVLALDVSEESPSSSELVTFKFMAELVICSGYSESVSSSTLAM